MEIPPQAKDTRSGSVMHETGVDSKLNPIATKSTLSEAESKESRKRSESSLVWDHFFRPGSGNTGKIERIRCSYCETALFYTEEWGTFSMRDHLDVCSEYPYNWDKKQKLSPSSENFEEEESFEEDEDSDSDIDLGTVGNWSFDQGRCRVMLARMIIIDALPFSQVEREGFRKFLSSLQPLFEHVSRFTVARDCIRLYLIEKFKLKDLLETLGSQVALSINMWGSNQNMSYLCLTAHFIDDEWKLRKKILSFVQVPSDDGREIGSLVEKCVQEWGLEGRISAITVGNGSSDDGAVTYLREKWNKFLFLDGDLFQMRCANNCLNLIVKDRLDEFDDSICRIRSAVGCVRRCPFRVQQFMYYVEEEDIPFEGPICLDIPARWDTTYIMLDRAFMYRTAFRRLEEEDPSFLDELHNEKPTNDDWKNAGVLAKSLGKFYETAKTISGSSHATSNLYFYEMSSLLSAVNDCANDPDLCLRSMSRKLKEDFVHYYGNVDKENMIVLIALVLDPRYKLKFIKFSYMRIYDWEEEKVDEILTNLKVKLERVFEFYRAQTPNAVEANANDGCPLKRLVNEFDEYMKEELILAKKSELDLYLEQQCEDRMGDFDILTWWKNKGSKYKVLSRMARDILAMPASRVTSEAAFSMRGLVLDPFRSSLTPKVAEALVCAQDWLSSGPTAASFVESIEDSEKYQSELTRIAEVELLGE